LERLLDQLAAAGVRHAVVCTGYRGEQVQAVLGDSYNDLRLEYSQEEIPRGTAGALRLGLERFHSDPVLVLNGDSFCDVDLRAFHVWHCERDATATLVLAHVGDAGRYGRVDVDDAGRVCTFREKDEGAGPGWINAGIYLLGKKLLESIPAGGNVSLERECFPAWIARGLYGYRTQGRFLDIGTPESLSEAHGLFRDESCP
jgi:NDP-sugar pyrophosphorylase family protein